MTAGKYGVATNRYGTGMMVTDKFDTLDEAEAFAAQYLPGGAVVCTLSDGRWRAI